MNEKKAVVIPSGRKPCSLDDLLANLKETKITDKKLANKLANRIVKTICFKAESSFLRSFERVFITVMEIRPRPLQFLKCFVEQVKFSKIGAARMKNLVRTWTRQNLTFGNAREVEKICRNEMGFIDDLHEVRAVDLDFYREMVNSNVLKCDSLCSVLFIFRILQSVDRFLDSKGISLNEGQVAFWKKCAVNLRLFFDEPKHVTTATKSQKRAEEIVAFLDGVERKGGWDRQPGKRVLRQTTLFESFSKHREIRLTSETEGCENNSFRSISDKSDAMTEPLPKFARQLSAAGTSSNN